MHRRRNTILQGIRLGILSHAGNIAELLMGESLLAGTVFEHPTLIFFSL